MTPTAGHEGVGGLGLAFEASAASASMRLQTAQEAKDQLPTAGERAWGWPKKGMTAGFPWSGGLRAEVLHGSEATHSWSQPIDERKEENQHRESGY